MEAPRPEIADSTLRLIDSVSEILTMLDGRAGLKKLRKNSLARLPSGTTAYAGVARFGVRQLAAAFRPASLLAGFAPTTIPIILLLGSMCTVPSQQAGSGESGSKLPHSKASLRLTTGQTYFRNL